MDVIRFTEAEQTVLKHAQSRFKVVMEAVMNARGVYEDVTILPDFSGYMRNQSLAEAQEAAGQQLAKQENT